MDSDWLFHLGEIKINHALSHDVIYGTSKAGACMGVPQADFCCDGWDSLNLPHDWSVKLKNDLENSSPSWGYKPKGKAWYRKQFALDESFRDRNLTLEFDGVSKDCLVYFNGSLLKRHYSAYAPFSVDITDRAFLDGTPNVLAVFVDADSWEGWWYEGAGIYRHVRLVSKSETAVARYGIYAITALENDEWFVLPQITLENTGAFNSQVQLRCEILDAESCVVASENRHIEIESGESKAFDFRFKIDKPLLWGINSPNLYRCKALIFSDEKEIDCDEVNFGFRTIRFDAEEGFFLNGENVKLYGTCNHQVHGGIGVAIPDSVHEYRIHRLKEMGSNAYRCAHGMPHSELLDVCDREGMLVMDENRSFETSEQCLEELRTMVLRDRNHPSVIMWSIFNEEPLQGTEQGMKMAAHMRREILKLDDSRFVTGAMNGGVDEEIGAAQSLDVVGINYQLYAYDEFHERYPDIPVVGSETTSTFSIRGCYKTNFSKNQISCYDEDPADWGNTVRHTWECIENRKFASGGFMWTGFDYLGEPTPFVYPSVSSFFGMMDTCGFAKDAFYLAKAFFSDEAVCHLLPHWNFKGHEGEKIRVMSHTNCEEAELFLNDASLGRKRIDIFKQAYWEIEYQSGELKLVGFNNGKIAAECVRKTTGEAADVLIECANVSQPDNSGLDAVIVNFTAVDENGLEVEDFCGEMTIEISGGTLVGASNGDPNCHEPFDSNVRSLFNGKAQAIISPDCGAEYLTIGVICGIIKVGGVRIELAQAKTTLEQIESLEELRVEGWRVSARLSDSKPDPLVKISDSDMNSLEPYIPANGNGSKMAGAIGKYALFRAKAFIPNMINDKAPTIHFNQLWGKAEVWVNGKLRLTVENEWAQSADIKCEEDMLGEAWISVVVKCINKYGSGVTSSVVIR